MLPATMPAANRFQFNELWNTWAQQCEALLDPDVELIAEEFAPMLSTYKQLRGLGAEIDRGVVALMTALERQLVEFEEDREDSDEDVDESPERSWQ